MAREVVKVHVSTDQEEAARLVSRYNLLALLVVDDNEVLVGIITVDDVIDVLREEATEDILKMAGTSEEEITSFSVWRSVRVRLPWLFVAWIGGVVAIEIIGGFEGQFGDRIKGSGSMQGYAITHFQYGSVYSRYDGDRDDNSKITKGTWKTYKGTGKLENIRGRGTFSVKAGESPGEFILDMEGEYEL